MKHSIQFYIFVVCFILSTLHSFTLYANTQSSDSFHICYFSLNNEKEFTEMEKFTKKLNEHSSHPISVGEYMTEGGSPEESFKKMIDAEAPCDGLVISGHHTGSFGGKRASGSLSVGFLEKISCDEKYSDWFKNIQALWLQGCRTLGTGEIVSDQQSDQQEEVSADHHTLRVGNVLDEDHLEQSLADLDMEFSATLDQDNPLSSRYLRVFPMATVFGWTKTAPGERAGSQYSIPFHIAHIARLNNKEDQFPTSKPIDETLDPASATQYAVSLINLLNGDGNECEDSSINAWKRHGTVEDQNTGLGFLNPDLNAYPALTRSDNEILEKARLLDCLLNNSKTEENLLKAIDDILKDPELIRYTFNSLLEKLQALKQSEPELHKKIVDKLKASSEMSQFLSQKLESPSLGILRKIDYFAFYEELYGKSDKIRAALLDQSIKILKTSGSSTSYDVRDYKITLLRSLSKHGYLSHPKGISVLEQAMKDSHQNMRFNVVELAGEIGKPALPIVEQGLKDSDAYVRLGAVEAAGKIGVPALHIVEQGMKDSRGNVRFGAVRAAGEIGVPALHLVEQGLNNSKVLVRFEAVEAARKIGVSALHIVEQGMKDSHWNVRLKAVRAAGEIGEPALHLVEQGMKDSDMNVREQAVVAAGEIGEPALPVLEQGMKDSHWNVRLKAVRAASEMGEPALPLVTQGMEDSNEDVRLGAVEAAGEIGEPALHIVEQGMKDSDRYVRKKAVESAGKIGEPALHLVRQGMKDSYRFVRQEAVEAAGEIGKPALHLVEQGLQDSNKFVRKEAVEAAGEIGKPALHLVEQGLQDSYRFVRIAAVRSAGKIGEPALSLIESKGLPVLEQALQDSDRFVRIAAVEAAGEIGELALPLVEQGMKDSDVYVRSEAVKAAGEIGELALPLIESKGLPVLEQALQDSDRFVRIAAVEAAGEIGELALPLVEQGMKDLNEDVRFNAVAAAEKIGEPALPLLRKFLEEEIDTRDRERTERTIRQINESTQNQ